MLGETVAEVATTDLPGFSAPPWPATPAGSARSASATSARWSSSAAPTTTRAGGGGVVHGVRTAARPAAGRSCSPTVRRAQESWTPGTPVLISDHINLTGRSPIVGANFVDLTDLYSSRLRALCREVVPSLDEGVYVQFPRAALRDPGRGADGRRPRRPLVGMSTTLEAIAAREAGMEILGISLVTNLTAQDHQQRAARPRGGPRKATAAASRSGLPPLPGCPKVVRAATGRPPTAGPTAWSRWQDVAVPEPGPGEVRVAVAPRRSTSATSPAAAAAWRASWASRRSRSAWTCAARSTRPARAPRSGSAGGSSR